MCVLLLGGVGLVYLSTRVRPNPSEGDVGATYRVPVANEAQSKPCTRIFLYEEKREIARPCRVRIEGSIGRDRSVLCLVLARHYKLLISFGGTMTKALCNLRN